MRERWAARWAVDLSDNFQKEKIGQNENKTRENWNRDTYSLERRMLQRSVVNEALKCESHGANLGY